MATYTSQYPPAHNTTYVKATTRYSINSEPWFSTDPSLSLTGSGNANSWYSAVLSPPVNQRFHIDLGSAKIIRRIYYENHHSFGSDITRGAKNFTFWGSNTVGDFNDLVYANDHTWVELDVSQNTFDIHSAADEADPKYIVVDNAVEYRYYAFKFADNYDDAQILGTRQTELQTEDGWSPVEVNAIFFGANF